MDYGIFPSFVLWASQSIRSRHFPCKEHKRLSASLQLALNFVKSSPKVSATHLHGLGGSFGRLERDETEPFVASHKRFLDNSTSGEA